MGRETKRKSQQPYFIRKVPRILGWLLGKETVYTTCALICSSPWCHFNYTEYSQETQLSPQHCKVRKQGQTIPARRHCWWPICPKGSTAHICLFLLFGRRCESSWFWYMYLSSFIAFHVHEGKRITQLKCNVLLIASWRTV